MGVLYDQRFSCEDRRLIERVRLIGSLTVLIDGELGRREIIKVLACKFRAKPQSLWRRIIGAAPDLIPEFDSNFFLNHGSDKATFYDIHEGKVVSAGSIRKVIMPMIKRGSLYKLQRDKLRAEVQRLLDTTRVGQLETQVDELTKLTNYYKTQNALLRNALNQRR